jgi:hypothetical protein
MTTKTALQMDNVKTRSNDARTSENSGQTPTPMMPDALH